MDPSIQKAKTFFHEYALPRRTRDVVAEQRHKNETDSPKIFYRRVGLEEQDRGEEYPLWSSFFDSFAHFGIGIGIYFSQLVFLIAISLVGGLLMIIAANAYNSEEYNASDEMRGGYAITAMCSSYVNVTATVGCPDDAPTCRATYARDCQLPYLAGVADLAMSAFFAAAVFLSAFMERKIIASLDEAVQTVSDYSVEVKDPPPDADDPDEWQNYFSRYGVVRYVTILRSNSKLLHLVRKTHKYSQKMLALQNHPSDANERRFAFCSHKLETYSKQLEEKCRLSYPVCRVYVTFEYEEQQRLCLMETEVPDIHAIFDFKHNKLGRTAFRTGDILDIVEPPEPDNILWENLEVPPWIRGVRRLQSLLGGVTILVATWYLVEYTKQVSPGLLAVVIGLVDSVLPMLFESMTNYGLPLSEGMKQSFLQLRLFAARLLLSTVLPYVQTEWNKVLEAEFVSQVTIIQVAACFTAPIISIFDPAGFISKYILSRSAETQEEMNLKWSGSDWSLAEKYTGISKVLFVSLYYALLIPHSLFLCVPTFLLLFVADRYLLLRKWRQMPMLDHKVAVRLRQQAILAVAAHMYVSMRLIYSWPMDEAWDNDGVFHRVDKYPNFGVWDLNLQEWQSSGQKRIFYSYKICLFLTAGVSLVVWVIIPALQKLRRLFCRVVNLVGESQKIPFSSLKKVDIYEPLIRTAQRNYLCAHVIDVLPGCRPSVLVPGPSDPVDLSFHIPASLHPYVLSVVKFYGTDAAVSTHKYPSALAAVLDRTLYASQASRPTYELALRDEQSHGTDVEEAMLTPPRSVPPPPPPPALPAALMDKIKGKPVVRADGQSVAFTDAGGSVQRVRILQQQRDKEEVVANHRKQSGAKASRDFGRPSSRILPTAADSPPPKAPRHNHRYSKQPSYDDEYGPL